MKKEGDQIKPGDILASIETDKASVDFEMQEEGYIAKLLYPEGTKDIPLGRPVAVIVDKKEDVDKFKDYQATGGAAPAKKAEAPKTETKKEEKPTQQQQAASPQYQ